MDLVLVEADPNVEWSGWDLPQEKVEVKLDPIRFIHTRLHYYTDVIYMWVEKGGGVGGVPPPSQLDLCLYAILSNPSESGLLHFI